jgi:hypothetical protein
MPSRALNPSLLQEPERLFSSSRRSDVNPQAIAEFLLIASLVLEPAESFMPMLDIVLVPEGETESILLVLSNEAPLPPWVLILPV